MWLLLYASLCNCGFSFLLLFNIYLFSLPFPFLFRLDYPLPLVVAFCLLFCSVRVRARAAAEPCAGQSSRSGVIASGVLWRGGRGGAVRPTTRSRWRGGRGPRRWYAEQRETGAAAAVLLPTSVRRLLQQPKRDGEALHGVTRTPGTSAGTAPRQAEDLSSTPLSPLQTHRTADTASRKGNSSRTPEDHSVVSHAEHRAATAAEAVRVACDRAVLPPVSRGLPGHPRGKGDAAVSHREMLRGLPVPRDGVGRARPVAGVQLEQRHGHADGLVL